MPVDPPDDPAAQSSRLISAGTSLSYLTQYLAFAQSSTQAARSGNDAASSRTARSGCSHGHPCERTVVATMSFAVSSTTSGARSCEGFRMPARRGGRAALRAGVRKPPGKEPAGAARRWRLWGFDRVPPAGVAGSGRSDRGARRLALAERPRPASRRVRSRAPQAGRCRCDRRHRGVGSIGRAAAPGAGSEASGGLAMRRGADGGHGVAVLTPGSDGGGPRGAPPRSKISTMIMRPPQQGHGGRWSAAPWRWPWSSRRAAVCGSGAAISSLARAILALRRRWRAARSGGCGGTPWAGRGAGSA